MIHQHTWNDVSYDYVWTYEFYRCQRGGRWATWSETKVYKKEDPGPNKLDCDIHGSHHRYPVSQTIIHQKCDCGNYREQYVDGILNSEIKKCDSEDVRDEINRILNENKFKKKS